MKQRIVNLTQENRLTLQLIAGLLMFVFGIALMFTGLLMPPIGEIDSSVLTAFGEVATFASALCGMDYSYRSKKVNLEREYEEKTARLKKEIKEE